MVNCPGMRARASLNQKAGQNRMTALAQYQRLEAPGLWRENAQAQRREVIVAVGDATLTICDMNDRPLAHWSLAALARANPGKRPAIYHPDGDPSEQLELAADATEMVDAIEKLRNAIARRRPHPGRLRLLFLALSLGTVLAGGFFWLPGALRQHAVSVVPEAKRAELGAALRRQLTRATGPACADPAGSAALARLAARLPDAQGRVPTLFVVRDGVQTALPLPGGTVLLAASVVEDHDSPDVVAGHVLAAGLQAQRTDPLDLLLAYSGISASFRLLTTGSLPESTLQAYAEHLATTPLPQPPMEALISAFARAGLPSTPYARALDQTGENTLPLIEADPFTTTPPANMALSDGDWLRLQAICGN